jgi:Flp pilus assembly protein TadG
MKREDGGAMVEFALLIMVLLLIILGVIQFGLMFYTKYVITAGSREGARYGSIYRTDSVGDRLAPANLNPTIEQVVRTYINNFLIDADGLVTVELDGAGYTTGNPGADLIVRVHCQNPWDFLSGLLPTMSGITFHSETIMKVE